MNDKAKIGIMAGVLAVLIAGFVFFFLSSGSDNSTSSSPGGTSATAPAGGAPSGGTPTASTGAPATASTRPPVPGAPVAPGTPVPGRPGVPGASGASVAAQTPPGLAPPTPPKAAVPQPLAAGIPDPFAGFPADPIPQPPKPKPRYISVVSIPLVTTKPAKTISPTPVPRQKKPTIGRLAGWVYNANGQVVAIFEDRMGKSRALKVGDIITDVTDEGTNDYHVTAITTDTLILEDEGGQETTLKLQTSEMVPGNRGTSVTATLGVAPPITGWGAR